MASTASPGRGLRQRALAAEDAVYMERCEGYYRLENRRCDRSATRDLRAADGHFYLVCDYHARQAWTAAVARWNGQSGIRASAPTGLRTPLAHAS
jgi:hypothetical protein